jgi:hypothetical protein
MPGDWGKMRAKLKKGMPKTAANRLSIKLGCSFFMNYIRFD